MSLQVIHDCIYRLDPEVRKKLWETLVLAGGSTLASGFVERLERELPSVVPQVRIRGVHGSCESW